MNTVTIAGISYTYTQRASKLTGETIYNLTGPRGSTYFTIRNPQTQQLAAFSRRSPGRALPGFLAVVDGVLVEAR